MLSEIYISNFRGLRRLDAPLNPLTILIGQNDTGKSSFLAAINSLSTGDLDAADVWRRDRTKLISIEGETEGGRILIDSKAGRSQIPELFPTSFYQLPVQGVVMHSPGYGDQHGPPQLEHDGRGVSALLDFLLRRDRPRFFAIIDALKASIRGLKDIGISTPDAASRRLDLILDDGFSIPADQASAGVRLMLFFVALAYHPSPPRLILLEEPETGVHPKRLAEIMGLLRDITKGKHGSHASQIILTTHSPYLLDSANLEEDQVLVFRREEDGSRTAETADAERLRTFLDEFLLGEVWFNQGEEGLVSRRP